MLIAQRPILTEDVVAENRSRFAIEPLEPGFGYTLGNSLRRTLLSSIPGAAVTSIRIDGVLHEFTTVPGVKEDVTELILNLKELVVSSEEDEGASLADLLGADDHRLEDVERSLTVGSALEVLDGREREILRLRFQDDLLQSEIAERVGCSQMHVSRIIRSSLERLYAYGTKE